MGIYVMFSVTPGPDNYFGDDQYCSLRDLGDPNGAFVGADATNCYPPCLLRYGEKLISQFSAYPHALAAVVGNEVMFKDPRPGICVKQVGAA